MQLATKLAMYIYVTRPAKMDQVAQTTPNYKKINILTSI